MRRNRWGSHSVRLLDDQGCHQQPPERPHRHQPHQLQRAFQPDQWKQPDDKLSPLLEANSWQEAHLALKFADLNPAEELRRERARGEYDELPGPTPGRRHRRDDSRPGEVISGRIAFAPACGEVGQGY